MIPRPYFSIAIPFFYRNHHSRNQLIRCIKSIRSQLFVDYEIIISTQNCYEKLISDPELLNIKVLNAEDIGGFIQGNVNNAMKESVGKWIKIMFSDDYFLNAYALQSIYSFLEETSCNWAIMNSLHVSNNYPTPSKPVISYFQRDILSVNSIGSPSSIVFINKNPPLFDIKSWMKLDVDFYYTLYKKYGRPSKVPNTFIVNETHSRQFSSLLINQSKETKLKLKNEFVYLCHKHSYYPRNSMRIYFIRLFININRKVSNIMFKISPKLFYKLVNFMESK